MVYQCHITHACWRGLHEACHKNVVQHSVPAMHLQNLKLVLHFCSGAFELLRQLQQDPMLICE